MVIRAVNAPVRTYTINWWALMLTIKVYTNEHKDKNQTTKHYIQLDIIKVQVFYLTIRIINPMQTFFNHYQVSFEILLTTELWPLWICDHLHFNSIISRFCRLQAVICADREIIAFISIIHKWKRKCRLQCSTHCREEHYKAVIKPPS